MKILSVNKFFWRKGGSETVFFGEKALLESKGHTVVPFSMKGKDNLESEYTQYFVEEIDYDSGGAIPKLKAAVTILFSFDARQKIKSLLKKFTPDVAHFHIFQHQITPSVFAPLRKLNVPVILTLHDLKPICPNYKMYTNGHVCEECKGKKFYKSFSNKCTKGSAAKSLISTAEMYLHYMLGYYQNVDQYIAVSKFYKQKMIDFGFQEDQVSYLPNYIDTNDYALSNVDDNYVLYFGRLSEEKGVDTLISAASLCTGIPIVIAGSGPDENKLKELAATMQIDNISFVGFKTGSDLNTLISHASFTVITSKWYENCPMSVLESMAYGKPVIGAEIGGIPELIDDGIDGLVYQSGDHDDLASKIRKLWEMGNNRLEMGMAGRKKVEKNFSPDAHYEKLIEIYNKVAR